METLETFRKRLRRAAEEGILLFVKHALVVGLWAGSSYLLWTKIAVVAAQAGNGQLGYQWLIQNQKELVSLVEGRKQADQTTKTPDGPAKK
jgi:hypothetical protein